MSELSQLADALVVSDRTIRRAVADGLVRAQHDSPRRAHVTVGERRYLSRAWPLLSELRAALRTEPNVRLAVLFGSVARGDDQPGSDVDIAVSLAVGGRDRRYDLHDRLVARTRREVQLVELDRAEREPLLLADILHDGRVLVDRDRTWAKLKRRERELRRTGDADLDARAARALQRIGALAGNP